MREELAEPSGVHRSPTILRVLAYGADDCVAQDVLRVYSIAQDVLLLGGGPLPTPTMIRAASCGAGGAAGVDEGATSVAGGAPAVGAGTAACRVGTQQPQRP